MISVNLTAEYEQELLNKMFEMNLTAFEKAKELQLPVKQWLNQKELFEMLNIGATSLKTLEKHGLKSSKLGNQVLYHIDEVNRVLKLLEQ